MKLRQLFVAATLCMPLTCFAAFDDLQDLEGMKITYGGEFEKLECRGSGKDDCRNWPEHLYKARKESNLCFVAKTRIRCASRCHGLIGDGSRPYVVFIDRFGDRMDKVRSERPECPRR